MNILNSKFFLALLAIFFYAIPVAAQDEVEDNDNSEVSEEVDTDEGDMPGATVGRYRLGNGVRLISSNMNHLTMSGMIQLTTDSRHYDGVDKIYNRFRMRRARIRFDGNALNNKIRYRLGVDLVKGAETDAEGNGSLLQDAWIAYRPWGNNKLQVTFGQRSTPTDNFELSISSHTMSFVERSKVSSIFGTIREIGLFVEGSYKLGRTRGVIRPSIAITDGDGPITGAKRYGGLKYGARINYLPFGTFRNYGQSREGDMAYEFDPKLCIGAAYSYNCGTSDRRGGRSSGDILYMDAKDRYKLPDYAKFIVDASFKWCGFSAIAEFAKSWGYVSDKITQRVRTAGTVSSDFVVDGLDGNHPVEYIKSRMNLGWGVNFQMDYTFRSMWVVGARYTHIGADQYSFLNNDLYFNRSDFVDFSVAKYLTRNYASKIQLTVGWTNPKGTCRTPDSRNYTGNEWNVDLMYQIKF